MVVVAPTGVAAINAGGVTIHSFFQLPFGPHIPSNAGDSSVQNHSTSIAIQRFNREKINIIRSLDLLVIDEISMVRADLLDGIDEVLRRFRDRNKPFGGVQLLMIGDLQQLAPVVKDDEWEILRNYYGSMFFFDSHALKKTHHISIELKHIYRQSDHVFIGLLNKVRENNVDDEALRLLNQRYVPDFRADNNDGYIILTTHNSQAQHLNESKLKELPEASRSFIASVEGEFPEYSYPTDFELILKEGAQVMFVKNDSSRDKLYFNGKIGIVESIDDDGIMVKCEGDLIPIPVLVAEWQNMKYTLDEETKEIRESVIGKFIQYPLKLAWAITIHKSQGLTFEKAMVDARAAFAHGQVYVALSRCKTLEGLVLSTPISQKSIIKNDAVSEFVSEIEQHPAGENQLTEARHLYQKELVTDLFDFSQMFRQLNYCIKLFDEHKGSLAGNQIGSYTAMAQTTKTEILEVAGKFKDQLVNLVEITNDLEKNEVLQDRIKKASSYFANKIKGIVQDVIQNTSILTDNKTIRKSVNEAVERLRTEVSVKVACLDSSTHGFSIKEHQNEKAKAILGLVEPKKEPKETRDQLSEQFVHPELFRLLKSWRDTMAKEKKLPHYMILPQKTMMELVETAPSTMYELKKIKGIGKKNADKYGEAILEIVNRYRLENKIDAGDSPAEAAEVVTLVNPPKKNTRLISFELYKNGKTLEQIANERAMTVTSVEGHLASFVASGEIQVSDFVSREKLMLIENYFIENATTLLAPAKAALGEAVTWADLRFVLKHLEFLRSRNEN